MKKVVSLGLVFISSLSLAACGETKNETPPQSSNSENQAVVESSSVAEEQSSLDILNTLATMSKTTDEIYVTKDLVVGENGDVTPGIYDVEITGGRGNIMGTRDSVTSLFINWVAGAKDDIGDYPSKIRMVLFNNDTLSFSNISKVKFNAVPETVEPSTQLGVGEFIVGRDIPAGNYKLKSNISMDPQFDNLGWSTSIYNDSTGQTRDQTLNPSNDDVAVTLEDGEIISISFDNTVREMPTDDARLIFEKF
ncbi:hypothetical protein [Enterococcus casseliflavus]